MIKINRCRNISFSTKLKTNFIKKVDLLIYNFCDISSEVKKHLIYQKTDYYSNRKFYKFILTKKNYMFVFFFFVHCVNLSVNLMTLSKACALSRQSTNFLHNLT